MPFHAESHTRLTPFSQPFLSSSPRAICFDFVLIQSLRDLSLSHSLSPHSLSLSLSPSLSRAANLNLSRIQVMCVCWAAAGAGRVIRWTIR